VAPTVFGNTEPNPDGDIAWAPGSRILYNPVGLRNLHILDPQSGTDKPLFQEDTVGYFYYPCYSPDGKKIAACWSGFRGSGLWLFSVRDTTRRFLCSIADSRPLFWSPDGRRVFVTTYLDPCAVVAVSTVTGESEEFVKLSRKGARIAHMNTTKIVLKVVERQSDSWLFDNFDPEVE